ncbi:WD40 repeat-like protein [Vararia minispora EC-137]|uniref:WD40 repeat-like protein n=1 Tax=Vararia minispora EC-137 TaxID=1314806 RepID=A0ACB8QAX8_9AGAM|nr:WD40 repeat-like protein [Vararia minispora EC-137]
MFSQLIGYLEKFTSLVDAIGEIHPYAKMATTIVTSVIVDQRNRDDAIKDLVDEMTSAYALVNGHSRISNPDEARKKLLKDLAKQTVECAYFIRDYASIKSFWKRAAKNALPGSDIKGDVDKYKSVFIALRRRLTEHGGLETEVHLRDMEVHDNMNLQNLAYVRGAGLNSAKNCLPGTRARILDDLSEWVNDPEGARVLFLVGVAGAGKSAIAHSLGSRFDGLRRLGCFFAFDRSFQRERHPESVLSTIAHELAGWNPDFKRALATILRDKSSLTHTTDIVAQWDSLIIQPAAMVTFIGPVLVVIDAFDECISMDLQSRRILLRCLLNGSASLPHNFRILVTSRPEDDIRKALRDRSLVASFDLSDFGADVASDIDAYVRHTLQPEDPEDDPLDEARLSQIMQMAEGLFQWASTACRVILQNPAGSTLRRRFDRRIASIVQGGSSLDGLYSSVLASTFPMDEEEVVSLFRSVMAQILCASEPLSIDTLQSIRSNASVGDKDDVSLVVRYMGALLSGVDDQSSPIRPLHTSFRDFLTSPSRSHIWHVDPDEGHSIMYLGSVVALNKGLRFNICNLETSYLRNSQIPNLRQRISSQIPSYTLSYAASCLKDHLSPRRNSSPLPLAPLRKLLCENLLLWLELLSVLGVVSTAPSVLRGALYLFSDAEHNDTRTRLQDALHFVHRFSYPISQSAPHVYISALAFAPTASVTRSYFTTSFSRTPRISGVSRDWPRAQTAISTPDSVHTVACSPDGRQIASGLDDLTVRIWDIESGEAVGAPFHGHSDIVMSVAYSHNGHRIVSGAQDSTVRIWDVYTGEAVCEPIQGHTSWVYTVLFSPDDRHILSASSDATLRLWNADTGEAVSDPLHHPSSIWAAAYSPDGTHIVSGCANGVVHIWNADTRESVGVPLYGHSAGVTSVACSPDGSLIASCSQDSTIRMWDASTGAALGNPFHGNPTLVQSVAFSPDGSHIVSGSYDSTIRIWNTKTGEQVELLDDHSGAVYSVMYAPDGRHIISSSEDRTVRIWDVAKSAAREVVSSRSDSHAAIYSAVYSPNGRYITSGHSNGAIYLWDLDTGRVLGDSFLGHSFVVFAVTYSPDGCRIASGSGDRTVRIWDASTKDVVGKPLLGHSAMVLSLAYSPDGQHIATGSADSTVRIWDTQTGQCVGNPLHGHSDCVFSVLYSPDGQRIISGSKDSTIQIWDAGLYQPVGESIRGHSNAVRSVAHSPNDGRIASGSWDTTVRIWDAMRGEAIGEPLRGHSEAVDSVAYSPDGRCIVSSSRDMTVRIWNAQTGDAVSKPFYGHVEMVMSVAYSHDGRSIVSSSLDGTMRIWDVGYIEDATKTGLEVRQLSSRTRSTSVLIGSTGPNRFK